MKNIPLLVVVSIIAGCSINNDYVFDSFGNGSHRERGMTHYIHLAVGDSLGYGHGIGVVFYYTTIGTQVPFHGQAYYKLQEFSFPLSGGCPDASYLIREDEQGDVYLSDSVEAFLLYKTDAAVGSTWYFGDTRCTLESRTDTVRTRAYTFTDCLRINIGSNWCARELDWLAPNIGLVKRDLCSITGVPLCVDGVNFELEDFRLKNPSRR